MGTRHIIKVIDYAGELRVSQYGQWDGYPEGQGVDILNFLSYKYNRDALEQAITRTRFLDFEGADKAFTDGYNGRAREGNMTDEDNRWFSSLMSRDLGSDILENLIIIDDDEILLANAEQGEIDGWIEWCYIIDFEKNKLFVKGYTEAEFELDKLPLEEDFLKELEDNE